MAVVLFNMLRKFESQEKRLEEQEQQLLLQKGHLERLEEHEKELPFQKGQLEQLWMVVAQSSEMVRIQ